MLSIIKHPACLIDNCQKLPRSIYKETILKEAILDYRSNALEVVDIGFGGTGHGHQEFTKDAKQTYAQTLAFLVTKNIVYAKNAEAIVSAWVNKCKVFKGNNAPLEASWGLIPLTSSLEILKYTYQAYNKQLHSQFIKWVQTLLLPHLRGETEKYKLSWGFFNNWHLSITQARLQFALFTDNLNEANWCIQRYKDIFNSYVKDNCFTGETLRDSDHCCFGLAGLVQICELAFHQGVDLYSLRNNLLQKCFEFHAKLYLGLEIPSGYTREQFNIYKWIQPCGWEIAFNHYKNRKQIKMPYTLQILNKIRPCNFELFYGYDTLTHSMS